MGRVYRNMGGKGGRDTATNRYKIAWEKTYGNGGFAHLDGKTTKLSAEELEAYLCQPRLYCFECGKDYKALGYHVSTMHAMSPKEYNLKHGLPEKTPLMSRDVRKKISESHIANHEHDTEEDRQLLKESLKPYRLAYYASIKNKFTSYDCEKCGATFQRSVVYGYLAKQKGSFVKCDACRKEHTRLISKKSRDKKPKKPDRRTVTHEVNCPDCGITHLVNDYTKFLALRNGGKVRCDICAHKNQLKSVAISQKKRGVERGRDCTCSGCGKNFTTKTLFQLAKLNKGEAVYCNKACASKKLWADGKGRAVIKHGESRSREAYVWYKLKKTNSADMCEDWVVSLESFINGVGRHPSPERTSLVKINMNGKYEPNNCEWVTKVEAARRRNNKSTSGK